MRRQQKQSTLAIEFVTQIAQVICENNLETQNERSHCDDQMEEGGSRGCGRAPGRATIMRYNEILNKNVTFWALSKSYIRLYRSISRYAMRL